MHFNTLFKLSSILSLAGLVNCGGYRMSFYGLNNNRPSSSAIPACGLDCDYSTDYYVALNEKQYYDSQVRKDNANTATVCDKCVKITYKDKWVVGRIVDKCPGCPNYGLDVSPRIFDVFADRSVGILYMDWEYSSCSLLGKSGTCKDGKCTTSSSGGGSSSSGDSNESSHSNESDDHEKTTKKTTKTKKRTTITTTTVSKSSSIEKPTTVLMNTKSILTKTKVSTKSINNIPSGIVNKPETKSIMATKVASKAPTMTKEKEKDKPQPTQQTVNQAVNEAENEESNNNGYIVPITSALVVSGAAGVALIYAKRQSTDINSLKEKFPEAFTNLKRSISRGSTVVRQNITRSLSNSGKAIKRSLSKKDNVGGPHIRTKKEYRESLDAHYPVQLYDPPMPSHVYNYIPNLPYQTYSSSNNNYQFKSNTNDNDDQLQIDFVDTYRYY